MYLTFSFLFTSYNYIANKLTLWIHLLSFFVIFRFCHVMKIIEWPVGLDDGMLKLSNIQGIKNIDLLCLVSELIASRSL